MSNNDNMIEKAKERKVRGFLNGRSVKAITFTIISLCIIFSMLFSILAIWDFAEKDVLYRTLATLGVVCLGSIIFTIINDRFAN